jgi:adenine/guanine phosphoribosyltransferase-like PRPP-binding protein
MHETNGKLDASGMAFQALAWALMEEARAERLLSLTGLTPDGLRASITERGTQAAILSFLEAHEPDLIACADVIGVSPAALVAARQELEA